MRVRAETRGTTVACYREFAPSELLRDHVRAFFSFVPEAEALGSAGRRVTREILFESGDTFVSPCSRTRALRSSLTLGYDVKRAVCG